MSSASVVRRSMSRSQARKSTSTNGVLTIGFFSLIMTVIFSSVYHFYNVYQEHAQKEHKEKEEGTQCLLKYKS